MRSIVASVFVLGSVGACDLLERPTEETPEVEEGIAVEGEVQRDDGVAAAGAVADARPNLDREISGHELWLAEARRQIEAGTRTANPETKKALDEIERTLRDARDNLSKIGAEDAVNVEATQADIRSDLAEVAAHIQRLDSAGTPG